MRRYYLLQTHWILLICIGNLTASERHPSIIHDIQQATLCRIDKDGGNGFHRLVVWSLSKNTAAIKQHIEDLLAAGVDPCRKNDANQTPLTIAQANKNKLLTRLINKAVAQHRLTNSDKQAL